MNENNGIKNKKNIIRKIHITLLYTNILSIEPFSANYLTTAIWKTVCLLLEFNKTIYEL